MKNCHVCNQLCDDNAELCPICGADISGDGEVVAEVTKEEEKIMIKICFVCHGNICRSPMAEYVLKDKLKKINMLNKFIIVSKATSFEEEGNDMHPGTKRILKENNIEFSSHRATKLIKEDYEKYDYFICMDENNMRNIKLTIEYDGKEFNGVNVENASYGACICAERSAILSAVSAGYRKGQFKELNVMVSSGKIGMPCFACRQVITEFFEKSAIVRVWATTGEYVEHTVEELCPYPFDSEDLV